MKMEATASTQFTYITDNYEKEKKNHLYLSKQKESQTKDAQG